MNSFESSIVESNPIGTGLDKFRDECSRLCERLELSPSTENLRQLRESDLKHLALDLVSALQNLQASRQLRSRSSRGSLSGDLSILYSEIDSEQVDIYRIIPLLHDVIAKSSDSTIFEKAYAAIIQATPPPNLRVEVSQTPHTHSTSSVVNSSEQRSFMDDLLKEELGAIYVNIPRFDEIFYGRVPGLGEAADSVFRKCQEGDVPLYHPNAGWKDWPNKAREEDVLKWFSARARDIQDFANELDLDLNTSRRPLARPNKPLQGSTAERKLDIGFVDDLRSDKDLTYHWSQILFPGELKSNPTADTATKTWLDLARYVREVLTAQDTRRFVLGFTLCGPIMRLWEFDRVGGIASTSFDINKDGLRFVSMVVGVLSMDKEQLGFDPTIMEKDGTKYIEICRNGRPERLILDALMKRAPCVVGRATTCWKAHRDGDESRAPLVIKDSWQFPERDEEGEMLRDATVGEVVNVARYYYHEVVQVGGVQDDVQANIRQELDAPKELDCVSQKSKQQGSTKPLSTSISQSSIERGRNFNFPSAVGRKRSSSSINASLPPSKRPSSSSPTKRAINTTPTNRVHRRVVVRDYGNHLYDASSRVKMLDAVIGCIDGYVSLLGVGIIQGDISLGNLMMNEDGNNPSWPAFLIDLDLAVPEHRDGYSGARGRTGTKTCMAIGALLGEKRSFMHDFESFFWALFWMFVHYNGPNFQSRSVPRFEKWNFADMEELAELKKGLVAHEGDFRRTTEEYFTPYYRSLAPWMNRLRKVVFPNGGRWEKEDKDLAHRMKEVLRGAQQDPEIQKESLS